MTFVGLLIRTENVFPCESRNDYSHGSVDCWSIGKACNQSNAAAPYFILKYASQVRGFTGNHKIL